MTNTKKTKRARFLHYVKILVILLVLGLSVGAITALCRSIIEKQTEALCAFFVGYLEQYVKEKIKRFFLRKACRFTLAVTLSLAFPVPRFVIVILGSLSLFPLPSPIKRLAGFLWKLVR